MTMAATTVDNPVSRLATIVLSSTVAAICILVVVFVLICRIRAQYSRWQRRRVVIPSRRQAGREREQGPLTVAFFHPYCSSGGGGERVLWKMVQVLMNHRIGHLDGKPSSHRINAQLERPLHIIIYTIDPPSSTYKKGV